MGGTKKAREKEERFRLHSGNDALKYKEEKEGAKGA